MDWGSAIVAFVRCWHFFTSAYISMGSNRKSLRGKMNRKLILRAIVVSALVLTARAKGQIYSGSVLYPFAAPSGLGGTDPTQFAISAPETASEGQVVGSGVVLGGGSTHAAMWTANGTPVDLNPTGLVVATSVAYGTNGTQQVGYGNGTDTGGEDHAMVWSGTAASAVDLNPDEPRDCLIVCIRNQRKPAGRRGDSDE